MVSYAGSCALFGSTYLGSWIYVNMLVLLVAISAVAIVYAMSKLLPFRMQGRMIGITKIEFTQLAISVAIIGILVAFSSAACTATSNMSSQYLKSAGVPSSVASLDPFAYSEYFIGNLSLNSGMKLLTHLYAESIAYGMDAQALSKLTDFISRDFPIAPTLLAKSNLKLSITSGYELGIPYSTLSVFYIGIFSSLITIAIGMLFIQYLALPVIEAIAFTVLLPIAIIMRSVAYTGGRSGLRRAANTFLAITIALYIIYPLTIALDSYIVHWVYTPCSATVTSDCNPNFQYLNTALTIDQISPSVFSNTESSATQVWRAVGISSIPAVSSLLNSVAGLSIKALNPLNVPQDAQYIIDTGSQFLFIAVILFALNIALTMVFAQSLAGALDSGIEGGIPLWSSL